jgi:hypothetical protein
MSVPGVYATADYDPHAFLFWPSSGLLVLPLRNAGALAMHVGQASLTSATFLRAAHGEPTITRALVIGSSLWTLSPSGFMVSDVNTLNREAWIAFE